MEPTRTYIDQLPTINSGPVKIAGWIAAIRDHGKILFIDCIDMTGRIQVVTQNSSRFSENDVVEISGNLQPRPEHLVNPDLANGHLEIAADTITILNHSKPLPFPITDSGGDINEELRLKYRYLDLRRPRLQRNLRTRSAYVQACRDYLFNHRFTEIETPLLTESTPEGSRDFVVPSRIQPGKFFALPQSPQQYKQLLMTAGFERYFQIARCLRDEDPRADRAFEHSQIDLEMSFVTKEQVMHTVESMITYALDKIGVSTATSPFPIISYRDAINQYGADKFDLRTEEQRQQGVLAFAWVTDFPLFEKTDSGGWTFSHNPFSQPIPEHQDWLLEKKNLDQIVANQYDLICNGFEVGGGSIRSHRPELLRATFEVMGYQEAQIQDQFGHMLEAFTLGTPPHGGCAHGFERLLMAIFNESYIREVQAFPQTGRGRTSVMNAPAPLSTQQLQELGLKLASHDVIGATLHDQIINFLTGLNITFTKHTHEPTQTGAQVASVNPTLATSAVKALIFQADSQPVVAVVGLDQKIDTNKFRKYLKVKDLRLATPEEVLTVSTVPVGSVPPLGSLYNCQTYLDTSLESKPELSFTAGQPETTITLATSDFIRAEQPQLASIAKAS